MVKIKVYIELHFESHRESACGKKNMQQRKKDKNKINLLMHGRVKCMKLLIAKDVFS